MNRRLILVQESIFTEGIAGMHDELDKTIETLDIENLKNGIEEDEYKDRIKDLKEISYAMKCLSKKNFQDAIISMTNFEI